MKKPRRKFSEDFKRQAVEDYVSGRKSAAEVALEHGIPQGVVYKWKNQLEEKAKGIRVEELASEGHNPKDIKRIMQLEEELSLYKEKLAETTMHAELLKKVLDPHYPHLKNANGLDEIKRVLDQSKRRVK